MVLALAPPIFFKNKNILGGRFTQIIILNEMEH